MKAFTSLAPFASILILLSSVLAHGSLSIFQVDGVSYVGPNPGQVMDSPIRMISEVDPVQDLTSDDLSCGRDAANETATLIANATAGAKVTLQWRSGNGGGWPHNVGPIHNYLAPCNGDCTKFQSLDANWVKIDSALYQDQSSGLWVQGATFYNGQATYSFNIPSDTPSGNYLMRTEIIALHNAVNVGGAEVYPACVQLNIAGKSTTTFPTQNTVKFPGAYSPNDPGIHVDVYDLQGTYQDPGPAVVTSFAAADNGQSGSSDDNGSSGSSTSAPAQTTSTSASVTSSADGADCTDDGSDDGSDNGSDDDSSSDDNTVTVTVTVTTTPTRQHHTVYVTVTATPNGDTNDAAAASPTTSFSNSIPAPTVTPAPSMTLYDTRDHDTYPKRRSRIMGRRHF